MSVPRRRRHTTTEITRGRRLYERQHPPAEHTASWEDLAPEVKVCWIELADDIERLLTGED